MNSKKLAELLNGREYGSEMDQSEEAVAEAAGLVVVFGSSDDSMEFRGAINDEVSCYNGGEAYIHNGCLLEWHSEKDCECPFCGFPALLKESKKIEALPEEEPDYSWTYKTEIPHETFEILEDGKPYCRGIVFSVKDA